MRREGPCHRKIREQSPREKYSTKTLAALDARPPVRLPLPQTASFQWRQAVCYSQGVKNMEITPKIPCRQVKEGPGHEEEGASVAQANVVYCVRDRSSANTRGSDVSRPQTAEQELLL